MIGLCLASNLPSFSAGDLLQPMGVNFDLCSLARLQILHFRLAAQLGAEQTALASALQLRHVGGNLGDWQNRLVPG